MTRLAIMYLVVEALFGQATSVRRVYRNAEFRVDLRVPQEAFLCSSPKGEHDHGFFIILGNATAKDCPDYAHHRSVGLFAFYNALDETKHLAGLLKMGCDTTEGQCEPAPSGLGMPGLASAAGQVKHSDGWIDLIVVTQAGEPSPMEPAEPSINYIFDLHTRSEHLEEDLKVFRKILQTVKLAMAR